MVRRANKKEKRGAKRRGKGEIEIKGGGGGKKRE